MSEHDRLVEELNDVMDDLSPLLKSRGKNKGVLLHQAINLRADESSLEGIIAFLRDYRKDLTQD